MPTDISRESVFTKYINSLKECPTYNSKSLQCIQLLVNTYTQKVRNFINDDPNCRANDEYSSESWVISSDILWRELIDVCISHRHYEDKTRKIITNGNNFVGNIKDNYLLDTVKELKSEIDAMKMAMSRNETHLLNTVKELKKEVDTLKAVISGKGDVMNSVMVIQRYWRKFLLLKNIKRLAREYEAVLLREFRKSLTMKSSITNKNLLSAAESRVRPPSKASGSNPENWSVAKAATIASDWNS